MVQLDAIDFETFLTFRVFISRNVDDYHILNISFFFSRVIDTTGRLTKRSGAFRSGDKPFRLSLLLIQLCLKSMLIRGHKIFALTRACTESTSEFVAVQ